MGHHHSTSIWTRIHFFARSSELYLRAKPDVYRIVARENSEPTGLVLTTCACSTFHTLLINCLRLGQSEQGSNPFPGNPKPDFFRVVHASLCHVIVWIFKTFQSLLFPLHGTKNFEKRYRQPKYLHYNKAQAETDFLSFEYSQSSASENHKLVTFIFTCRSTTEYICSIITADRSNFLQQPLLTNIHKCSIRLFPVAR